MTRKVTYSLDSFFFILFVVFCINFTELKVDVIKITEIVLLLLTPFIYYRTVNKWILYIAVLFTVWFLISIVLNPLRDFYLLKQVSVLKKPYLITVGRFLELISCINFAALAHKFFKNKNLDQIINNVKAIFYLNGVLLVFFLIIYSLNYYGFIQESNLIYYGDQYGLRLRAGYAEGGPYGLMLSFTFCLSFLYKDKYNNFFRLIIILTVIFIARSKAGLLCILLWILLLYYKKLYEKVRKLNIIFLVLGSLLISFVFVKLADNYLKEINKLEKGIVERPEDINLVMGRIAGLFIFPEMILDNPVFGIGLGNYPIMRNNPIYLGVIPPSPAGKTDAHGYGGIIQILVDGGFFTLIIFSIIIYLFYSKLRKRKDGLDKYLLIFLGFFMLGVQLYFLYPWFLFGILIALSEKPLLK